MEAAKPGAVAAQDVPLSDEAYVGAQAIARWSKWRDQGRRLLEFL